MRLFCAIALFFVANAVSANKLPNPCLPDPCYNGARCALAPFEELGFACHCPDCFSGPTCAENICAIYDERYAKPKPISGLSMSFRISGVVVGWTMMLIAVYCFCVEQRRMKKERKWFKKEMAALRKYGYRTPRVNDDDVSRVTTTYADGSRPYCERLHSIISETFEVESSRPTRSAAQLTPSLSFTSVSVTPQPSVSGFRVKSTPFPQPTALPAWDEVEMRRHGLVTRQCVRPTVDANFDAKSIDVSVREPNFLPSPYTTTISMASSKKRSSL